MPPAREQALRSHEASSKTTVETHARSQARSITGALHSAVNANSKLQSTPVEAIRLFTNKLAAK